MIAPPTTVATAAAIPIFFITSLSRNFALSGDVSGGCEGEGGPSDVNRCDGDAAKLSSVEWCEGTSDAERWSGDSDPSDADEYSSGADIVSSGSKPVDGNV